MCEADRCRRMQRRVRGRSTPHVSLMGARRWGLGVVLAGSSCDGRVMPESVSNDDLSQRYGHTAIAERDRVIFAYPVCGPDSCASLSRPARRGPDHLCPSVCGDGGEGGMLGLVRFLAIWGSRMFFSFFGLSVAATRPCTVQRSPAFSQFCAIGTSGREHREAGCKRQGPDSEVPAAGWYRLGGAGR